MSSLGHGQTEWSDGMRHVAEKGREGRGTHGIVLEQRRRRRGGREEE